MARVTESLFSPRLLFIPCPATLDHSHRSPPYPGTIHHHIICCQGARGAQHRNHVPPSLSLLQHAVVIVMFFSPDREGGLYTEGWAGDKALYYYLTSDFESRAGSLLVLPQLP